MKMLFHLRREQSSRRGRHSSQRNKFWHHLQEWIWPSMGWYNVLRLYEIRLKREQASANSVALGLAIGVFVSFTPFIGLHIAQMALYCFIFRGNFVASVIGSLVGNPWTFPFFFLWEYNFGNFILGQHHLHTEEPLNLTFQGIVHNVSYMWDTYLFPMTVGGVPTGLLVGFLTYYLALVHMKSYRKARDAYLKKRRAHTLAVWAEKRAQLKDRILHPLSQHGDK